MPPPTAPSSVPLNAWLGAALVVANGWLFYRYFFCFDARATDWLFYGPVLVSFLAAQWLGLARSSAPPYRRWFWVVFRLSLGAAVLAWLAYAYLFVWARLHLYHY
ncbi:MAG: hypothetical protein EOO62_04720 [Hymenobacter sp.]|nr:MAG: hypothetical protein EOO62_04720 [Hymenobacter sp.]